MKKHGFIVSIVVTIITAIILPLYLDYRQRILAEYEFQIEKSFWDASCRAWGDDEARPTYNEDLDKYVIKFEKALCLPINITFSCIVRVIKGNSTLEPST